MNISREFRNNDVYFLEVILDAIIINNNYDGVIILDEQLNEMININFCDQLIIEESFVKGYEIVLFDYENQRFTYLNTESHVYKVMKLNTVFEDVMLTPFFEWVDNDLFLIDYDATIIVHIDLVKGSVVSASKDYINVLEFKVQDNWNKLRVNLIHQVYSTKHLGIIEKDGVIAVFDYQNNKKDELNIKLPCP